MTWTPDAPQAYACDLSWYAYAGDAALVVRLPRRGVDPKGRTVHAHLVRYDPASAALIAHTSPGELERDDWVYMRPEWVFSSRVLDPARDM